MMSVLSFGLALLSSLIGAAYFRKWEGVQHFCINKSDADVGQKQI